MTKKMDWCVQKFHQCVVTHKYILEHEQTIAVRCHAARSWRRHKVYKFDFTYPTLRSAIDQQWMVWTMFIRFNNWSTCVTVAFL